jgi:hypothetical protein
MPIDVAPLQAAQRDAIAQAKSLAVAWKGQEANMPSETAAQINAWLGKADEAKAKIQALTMLDNADQVSQAPVISSWREVPAGPTEGDVAVDRKAWRAVTADTMFGAGGCREEGLFQRLRILSVEAVLRSGGSG